jgi:hypothetical protein
MAPPGKQVNYVHRESGELRAERIYGERELRFLYETWWGSALLHACIRRKWFSHLTGLLNRSPISRREISSFIQRCGIDDTESEFPATTYRSLDAFFYTQAQT